jgi:hypothetical protein
LIFPFSPSDIEWYHQLHPIDGCLHPIDGCNG